MGSQLLQNTEINIVVHWKFWRKYVPVSHLFSCTLSSLIAKEVGINKEGGINLHMLTIFPSRIPLLQTLMLHWRYDSHRLQLQQPQAWAWWVAWWWWQNLIFKTGYFDWEWRIILCNWWRTFTYLINKVSCFLFLFFISSTFLSLVTQPMLQHRPNRTELRSMDSYSQILCRLQKSEQKVSPLSLLNNVHIIWIKGPFQY